MKSKTVNEMGLGVFFADDISFEEWESYGLSLARIARDHMEGFDACRWRIGDWINFGDSRFFSIRKRYEIAVEKTGYVVDSLYNIKLVCSKVQISLRSEKLSFKHHAIVAPLLPAKQKKYLAVAEKEKLSVSELQKLIREGESEDGPETEDEESLPDSPVRSMTELSIWFKREKVQQWPLLKAQMWHREIAPIYEEIQKRIAAG